jgi:hypothetical protein
MKEKREKNVKNPFSNDKISYLKNLKLIIACACAVAD